MYNNLAMFSKNYSLICYTLYIDVPKNYSRHDKSWVFGVGVFGVFGVYLEIGWQSMLQPIHFRKDLEKSFPEMYGL